MKRERLIGKYTGEEKGPLFIVFGAMHGNEPAGVLALEEVFRLLEIEPLTNEDFVYKGRIVGLLGNRQAFELNQRYIDRDLNRQFKMENINRVFNSDKELIHEYLEIKELVEAVKAEIAEYPTDHLYILDLHTTSSKGGIFIITTNNEDEIKLAVGLHAPVIKGFLEGTQGTTLHYFNTENMGMPTTCITFESGQHVEPLSVNRAIAAITNYMREIGSVDPQHVENKHDEMLVEYSKDLPKVNKLVLRHDIMPGDNFKMRPNYQNFQVIKKGDFIADDKNGPIQVDFDCRILMPLYQTQGAEGFFLIKEE